MAHPSIYPTRAMVLAAGLGTRLRPLTDSRPKALVELNGRALLEIVLARLRAAGVTDVIINVHHFPELILAYLKQNLNFGLRIEFSHEDDLLLDTGGGLKKAAWFFQQGSGDAPFILHNVDVLSDVDLRHMAEFHAKHGALATLMVQDRKSTRQLLFDEHGILGGRRFTAGGLEEISRPDLKQKAAAGNEPQPLAFSGIHVISPRLFDMISEEGVFSIITTYLRLAAQGQKIAAFRADAAYWRDLGSPESLQEAAQERTGNAGKASG